MEIVIEPKMAFGTGHHNTTWLMIRELFSISVDNKAVLDMGCGTGILAIIAEKLGARSIKAIDNDEWAYKNAIENIETNKCSRIEVALGDASLLSNYKFDIILANINLNILLNDLGIYKSSLNSNGIILMSGILKNDVESIANKAHQEGFNIIFTKEKGEWVLILAQKK